MSHSEDFDMPLYESNVPFWVGLYKIFLEFVDVNGIKVRRFEKSNG